MKNYRMPHAYFALAAAALYIAHSLGLAAYVCAALLGLAHALSVLCGHEPPGRGGRACAAGLVLAALIALGMACGLAAPSAPGMAVQEVWV